MSTAEGHPMNTWDWIGNLYAKIPTTGTIMKKHFSNKDLDEFMEQAHKNNVPTIFLMLLGYPTETYQDFVDTLTMFKRYKKYQGIITSVALGTTCGILPGTPLAEELKGDIEMNNGENFWTYRKNPTLDLSNFKPRKNKIPILI